MPKLTIAEEKEARIGLILEILALHYPQAQTNLTFDNPYQLYVAAILSAQTTDEQVNRITTRLFTAIPSVYVMSHLEPAELEPYLKSCGLYRNKSRYLVEGSRIIVDRYNGQIPDNFTELIALPGIGRKTANVIISSAFGKPALAVDTHVFRVSRRLGLASGEKVEVVEKQLNRVIPKDQWSNVHHRLINHGRNLCHARNPRCESCFLKNNCQTPQNNILQRIWQ
ncbi:MAG: endonuclease III [Clostridia bacterium]|nr:endonuclease III [Clostridia bacterium]